VVPLAENEQVYDSQGEKIPLKIALNLLKKAIKNHRDEMVNDILNHLRRIMTMEVAEILRYLIEQAAKEDDGDTLQYLLGSSSATCGKCAITTIIKLGKKNAASFLIASQLCGSMKMLRKACEGDNAEFEVEGVTPLQGHRPETASSFLPMSSPT
jgi:hypothetical protein